MTGRPIRALALAAVLLLAAGAARAAPLAIRIAWTTVPGQLAPVLFAPGPLAQAGLLRHLGTSYTVETMHFAGSGPMVVALAAGAIDIAQLAPSSFASAVANAGMDDLRVIADGYQDGVPGHYSSEYLVRSDAPIRSIEDLKGKVLAVNVIDGATDIALQAMLQRHHLADRRDVTVVEGAFPNLLPMLEARKVDLAALVQPFSDEAAARGDTRILFRMADALGRTQMLFDVARAGFLARNRAALADFFADYLRALHWLFDPAHRAAAVAEVAAFNHRPASLYAPYLFTVRDSWRDPNARPDLAALQRNLDALAALGFVKAHIDVARHADLSFIDAAAQRAR